MRWIIAVMVIVLIWSLLAAFLSLRAGKYLASLERDDENERDDRP